MVSLLLGFDSSGIWYVGNMYYTDFQGRMVQETIGNRDLVSSRVSDLQDNFANG